MPIKERRDKFLYSKAIINKKKNRYLHSSRYIPNSQSHMLGDTYIYRDGLKVKLLSEKIINNLIVNRTIVKINNIEVGYILCNNINYIIFYIFNLDNEINNIAIINKKKLISIERCRNCIHLYVKNQIIIEEELVNFFYKRNSFLDKEFPECIKDDILSYLNIVNISDYLEYNINNSKELFNYLHKKDLLLEFYVNDYNPVLYGKIIKVEDSKVYLKNINLEGMLCSSLVEIEYTQLEYILICTSNHIYTEYYEKYKDSDIHNNVVNKINKNYTFQNYLAIDTARVGEIKDNIQTITNNSLFGKPSFRLDKNIVTIIDYLAYNPNLIKNITRNYDNNLRFDDNLTNNFDINLVKKEIDITDDIEIQSIIDKKLMVDIKLNECVNNNDINNVYIKENNENYLITENIQICYKKYISKIVYNYSNDFSQIIHKSINYIKNNENISNLIKNSICSITAEKYIDHLFYIFDSNEKYIKCKIIYTDCCLSANYIYILKKNIAVIWINEYYEKVFEKSYLLYNKMSIVQNYQKMFDNIYERVSKKFKLDTGFSFIGSFIYMYNIIWFSIVYDNGKSMKHYEYQLIGNYEIDIDSLEEDDIY